MAGTTHCHKGHGSIGGGGQEWGRGTSSGRSGLEYNLYQNPRITMIYLQEDLPHPSSAPPHPEALLKPLFRFFLLLLEEKKIAYTALPKEAHPAQATTSASLQIELSGRTSEVHSRISLGWAQGGRILNLSAEFRVGNLAGKKIADFPARTRIELITAIRELNQCQQQQHCPLLLAYNHRDALVFTAKQAFLTQHQKALGGRALRECLEAWLQWFLRWFGELQGADWIGSVGRLKQFQSMGPLLESLYTPKLDSAISYSQKQQRNIKTCLSFLLKRVHRFQAHFTALKQHLPPPAVPECRKEAIASGISIIRKERPSPLSAAKLADNLAKNEAVANDGVISLRKVTFQLRRSFGSLRPRDQEPQIKHYLTDSYRQGPLMHQEDLILKRCPTTSQQQTASTDGSSNLSEETSQDSRSKSQAECGHENEHNFLMVNGNLQCPFIGKYYLDVNEGSIETVTKRTIMTRFERGDLFTEVAFCSHYNLYHFTLLEYITIFEQLAEAVRFLQWNAMLHRDVKPTNVLFQYQGRNRLLCKLIDFGSCFVLRQDSQHLFNPKVFTTPTFNLTFREASRRTGHAIDRLFTQKEYETHELFDICGIAKTVAFLLSNSPHQSELLETVLAICCHPNPALRFTADQLLIVLGRMKAGMRVFRENN